MRFGQVDGGSVTPEMQAAWLSKYCHMIGVIGDNKYYVYDSPVVANQLKDIAFRVTFVDGKPVQVHKLDRKSAETIVGNKNLKFGNF